jgi:uncharacterized protein
VLSNLFRAALLGALVACAATPRAPSTPESTELLGDGWIGGFGPIEEVGSYVRVDFAADLVRLHPREGRAPAPLIRPHPAGRHSVLFETDDGRHRWTFALDRIADDCLEGTVTNEKGSSATARLVHVASVERAAVDAAMGGTYAIAGDPRKLLFVEDGRLFDASHGDDRRLFLMRDGSAVIGPGVGTAYPFRGTARRDPSGALRVDGASPVIATRYDPKREEVRFRAPDGVTLQGTLFAPPTPGPHPTVVFVHGSGHSRRQDPWENAVARILLAEGFAVFLYDKRGVGDSGGEYVGFGGRETNNVSPENLERLAGDVRAAITAITPRPDVDRARFGLLGLSQAGWIAPLAMQRNPAVRFFALISPPAVPTATSLAYESLLGGGPACMPIDTADRLVHEHAPRSGVDPAPLLAALAIPALFLYGSVDPQVPFQESMRVLERIKDGHDFTVKLAPTAGHELYLVQHDDADERQLSPGLSPVAVETLRRWLAARRGEMR